MNDYSQIIYFPYLSMISTPEINLGFARIWNFDLKAEEFIPDQTVRDKIRQLLSLNVRGTQQIRNIGILTFGDFSLYPQDQNYLIAEEARLLMFLSVMAENIAVDRGLNSGHYMMTSENFSMIIQNFKLESDSVGERGGAIVSRHDLDEISDKKFNAPFYLPTPLEFSYDKHFLKNLLSLRRKKKKLYRKILRAAEVFLGSYFNNQDISSESRILVQASAFEVLLDLSQGNQRKDFKEKVELYLVRPEEKKIRYKYEFWDRNSKRMLKDWETKALKVYWTDRFYTLRNHIIHGEKIKPNDFLFMGRHHVHVAPMFFFLLIKEIINEHEGKRLFYDGIQVCEIDTGDVTFKGFKYVNRSNMFDILKKIEKSNGGDITGMIPHC